MPKLRQSLGRGHTNLYRYVSNKPTGEMDPSGLFGDGTPPFYYTQEELNAILENPEKHKLGYDDVKKLWNQYLAEKEQLRLAKDTKMDFRGTLNEKKMLTIFDIFRKNKKLDPLVQRMLINELLIANPKGLKDATRDLIKNLVKDQMGDFQTRDKAFKAWKKAYSDFKTPEERAMARTQVMNAYNQFETDLEFKKRVDNMIKFAADHDQANYSATGPATVRGGITYADLLFSIYNNGRNKQEFVQMVDPLMKGEFLNPNVHKDFEKWCKI
jgi:hypothetical protein